MQILNPFQHYAYLFTYKSELSTYEKPGDMNKMTGLFIIFFELENLIAALRLFL